MAAYKGVQGGTPTGDALCPTCRNCHRVAGASASAVELRCLSRGGFDNRISFPILECSGYDDKRLPSRWDMEQIAWVLATDVKTKQIGFKSPRQVAQEGHTPVPSTKV